MVRQQRVGYGEWIVSTLAQISIRLWRCHNCCLVSRCHSVYRVNCLWNEGLVDGRNLRFRKGRGRCSRRDSGSSVIVVTSCSHSSSLNWLKSQMLPGLGTMAFCILALLVVVML